MASWEVVYDAIYWVEAETEEEAIEKAMEIHADMPDGDWNARLEPWV